MYHARSRNIKVNAGNKTDLLKLLNPMENVKTNNRPGNR